MIAGVLRFAQNDIRRGIINWDRVNIKQHHQKHKSIACQHAEMPDLVIAKIRREGIRFAVRKDQRANGVEEFAGDEQGQGARDQAVGRWELSGKQ